MNNFFFVFTEVISAFLSIFTDSMFINVVKKTLIKTYKKCN